MSLSRSPTYAPASPHPVAAHAHYGSLRLPARTRVAVGKFAAVKIIVFATYYQSLLVAIPGTGMDELGGSERWNDFIVRAAHCHLSLPAHCHLSLPPA